MAATRPQAWLLRLSLRGLGGTLGTTVGDGHHRGADDLATHAVALLVDLGDGLVVGLGVLLATHGLMHQRIEGLAGDL